MRRLSLVCALILCCAVPARAQFIPSSPACPTASSISKKGDATYWISRGFSSQYGFYRCTGQGYGLYVILDDRQSDSESFDLYLLTAGRISPSDEMQLDVFFLDLLGLKFADVKKLPDSSEIGDGVRIHKLSESFYRIEF